MEANTKESVEKGQSLQCWPPTVGLLPWLVFINGSSEENQTFYDISESHCHVKSIPELQGKLVATCSYGWLKIQLPSLTPDFSYDNCVLSSSPDNPECVVMFLDFEIGTLDVTFCKPGDVEWTKQDFKLHDEDDSDCVRSVGVHKGDICILTITLVDLKVDDNTCPTTRKLHSRFPTYLVETCGELLRLHCYIRHRQVVDIWDQAIFIGSSGGQVLACSTEESRIHGNKIYLTLAEERTLYVYDLDLCALEVCLPCPNVKADWVQNVWILPILED
ncbi:F-box/kelch-repeat protein [Salix suchowensis]|nr:F-box/kelch-repeat protein [Salix suchowensis]